MLKSDRITLLVIPEEGGKTFECKIPRLLLWFIGLLGIALCGLLVQGFRSYFDVHELDQLVARLERDKALLKEEVGQLEQLEEMLLKLKRSNDQLRTILSAQELDAGTSQRTEEEVPYISSTQRLRWGQVQTVPTLWPLRGQVLRRFSDEMPSVFIAAAAGAPVRASGAGRVVRAGYDERLRFVVVLDHGNDLSTEYGYLGRLLVEAGDYVLKGQTLALSGESREARGSGLHYAVREDGDLGAPVLYTLWM